MVFCSGCGKEISSDQSFCPSCGKSFTDQATQNAQAPRCRPTGITILAILQIIAGIFFAIAAVAIGIISGIMADNPFMMESFMDESIMDDEMMDGPFMDGSIGVMMATFGGAIAAILGVLAAISFFIAWALFSAKKWARTAVIVCVIVDLVIEAVSLALGNFFGIAVMILDGIILYYMWRPHVIAYFTR